MKMAFLFRRMAPMVSLARSIHSTPANSKLTGWEKIEFDLEHYRKYGLLKDDLLNDIDEQVAEAVSRLPEDVYMQRIFRSVRAQQLHLQHDVLPEDQWTTAEDDHFYLTPYLEEVQAENKERDIWDRTH